MSLVTNKLIKLQPGTKVEITLNDNERTKFVGIVSDNDFTESIEITNDTDELVLEYDDIKRVQILNSMPAKEPVQAQTVIPSETSTANQPVSTTPIVSENANLSFFCEVDIRKPTDAKIDKIFKDSLSGIEKKVVYDTYQSFKSRLKNNDTTRCAEAVNILAQDLEYEDEFIITENAWSLVAHMAARCCSHSFVLELFEKARNYENIAILHYRKCNTGIAVAYACTALLYEYDEELRDRIYTIIAKGSLDLKDFSGVTYALSHKPSLLLDKEMAELLRHVYSINGKTYPFAPKTTEIIADIKRFYKTNNIEKFIPEPEDNEPENNNSVEAETEAPVVDKNSNDTKYGNIVYLKWSEEKGRIEADDKTYEFEYTDVTDKKLFEKLKGTLFADLKAKNATLQVAFKAIGKNASDIKPASSKQPSPYRATAPATSREPIYVSQSPATSLKAGRNILAAHGDDRRFYKALEYFEKAITEESDIFTAINEYVNCCMAIANKENNNSYLDKAYNIYLNNRTVLDSKNGLSGNVALLDLFLKLEKKEEAKNVVDRILADPKIPVESRLNYILHKANILYANAEEAEKSEEDSEKIVAAYETANTAYLDWEQRFLEKPEIRNKSNLKKIYYNTILLSVSKCLIKIGDSTKAEEILKRVVSFDPTNENAKSLYVELTTEKALKNAEEQQEKFDNSQPESFVLPEEDYDDFDDDENDVAEVYDYVDSSGWKALGTTKEEVIDYIFRISGENRIPLALSYIKAASNLNNEFNKFYRLFSLAVNNPMEDLDYSLSNVVSKFSVPSKDAVDFKPYAMIAACLRGAFYHTSNSDYFVSAAYLDENILYNIPSLKKVFDIVEDFRTQTGKGMDLYADYHASAFSAKENTLNAIYKEAEELYNRYYGRVFHENVSQKRFKLTKKIIFEKGRFIEEILTCVKNNDTAKFSKIKDEFISLFIRQGTILVASNIDANKIEDYIDYAWAEAGQSDSIHERKSSQLMGSLRNNLRIPIKNIVELVCRWTELISNNNDTSHEYNLSIYRSSKHGLTEALKNVFTECDEYAANANPQEQFGLHVITYLADELIMRLDGSWNEESKKFFFADFLKTEYILLDDDYMPELTSTFCDLPEFNVLYRIRKHIECTGNADIINYAQQIYSADSDKHDFGTAEKIDTYLKHTGRDSEWSLPEKSDTFDMHARKQLRECYDNFNVEMCVSISRGQINVSDKFLADISDVAQYWYQYCINSKNYGFFFRLVEHCKEKIHREAKAYGDMLLKQLDILSREMTVEEDTYNEIVNHIENQFFTVADELISRISDGDFDSEFELPENTLDFLGQFWSEFEQNYTIISNGSGNLRRLVSANMSAKDRKGGEALIDSWPKSKNGCTAEQIETLLKRFGWSDISVSKKDISDDIQSYHVKENVHIYNKREYVHPIAAFGTQAYENGFYVVCTYGYSDSVRLIDLCRRLDSTVGNKIILIDWALSAAERRRLAKLMKQYSFANTYMFVDRVSLLYLANHYVGGGGDTNNRTLLAISMPFTFYQPYFIGSSSAISPEMFIGRRDELLSVESPQGANLIYGGRQLGKSAILKKAKNEIDDRENGRIAVVTDIKDRNCENAAMKISRELVADGLLTNDQVTDNWDTLTFNIKKSIQDNSISYFLLMLDEADCFIDACDKQEYLPLVCLKDLQQSLNGRFKFVLAGLHNVIKFKRDVALGNNSVITHLSSINVKPFDYSDAKQLLTEPLNYLGLDFSNNETAIMQILSATNYYPGLIQLYCFKLIEAMKVNYAGYSESSSPAYKISDSHFSKVLADKDFIKEIKEKFEITLRLGEGNHYFTIALLLAMLFEENESAEGYTADEIINQADDLGIDVFKVLPKDQINALLEELCDLNILKTVGSGYSFRTKSFRDLLGSKEEIFDELVSLLDKEKEKAKEKAAENGGIA